MLNWSNFYWAGLLLLDILDILDYYWAGWGCGFIATADGRMDGIFPPGVDGGRVSGTIREGFGKSCCNPLTQDWGRVQHLRSYQHNRLHIHPCFLMAYQKDRKNIVVCPSNTLSSTQQRFVLVQHFGFKTDKSSHFRTEGKNYFD